MFDLREAALRGSLALAEILVNYAIYARNVLICIHAHIPVVCKLMMRVVIGDGWMLDGVGC